MNKEILPSSNTTNQLFDAFAEIVAKRVVEELKESNPDYHKPITIESKPIESHSNNELYTIKEVCEILKISRGTLNIWRIKGILKPDTKVGRSPRYKRCSIDNFINNIET